MNNNSKWWFAFRGRWSAVIPALFALALSLSGCGDGEKATVHFKVLATIAYQGKLITAWTVMECRYTRVEHSLTGMGGDTTLYGEALIFHVNERERFYILPYWRGKSGSLVRFWEHAVLKSIGVDNPVGQLSDQDFERMRTVRGVFPVNYFGHEPLYVRFADEANPKSIEQLDPNNLSKAWPGMQFQQLDIEITDEPVTELLREQLPWLNNPSGKAGFNTYPPGKRVPIKDRPLSYIIGIPTFFGNGSLRWL
jgi:hypothetical protein